EFVDDVAQQVAADHPVLHTAKNGRDDLAPVVTVRTGQCAKIAEKASAFLAVGQSGFFVIDEDEEFVARDAVGFGSPIPPAVRRFDGGLELFGGELGLALPLK